MNCQTLAKMECSKEVMAADRGTCKGALEGWIDGAEKTNGDRFKGTTATSCFAVGDQFETLHAVRNQYRLTPSSLPLSPSKCFAS